MIESKDMPGDIPTTPEAALAAALKKNAVQDEWYGYLPQDVLADLHAAGWDVVRKADIPPLGCAEKHGRLMP